MLTKGLYWTHAALLSVLGVAIQDVPSKDDSFLHWFVNTFLGIPLDPAVFASGVLFSVVGGFIAMAISTPDEKKDKIGTLLVALFVGVLACELQQHLKLVNDWPPQVFMGCSGVASRKLFSMVREFDIGALLKRGKD